MKNLKKNVLMIATATMLVACASKPCCNEENSLDPEKFKTTIDEKPVQLYTLQNSNGMSVSITNFGGRVVSIVVPDKDGNPKDVVLGFDNIKNYADYENTPSDFGASIGRYANRIDQGKITVEGKTIQLPTNNYGHCLHGGPTGWQYKVYDATLKNDST
ncbi:MAG: galactose-1-epimerase, partial [Prevotella sp.]